MDVVGKLVLVVDDDEAICDTLEDALHLAGYRTLRATEGNSAIKLIRDEDPDLVVLDVNMPGTDGFEVMRRTRNSGVSTPVIFLTARHDKVDAVNGLRLGADDYVSKPFGLEELLLRVAAVLRRGSQDEPSVRTCGPITIDDDAHEVRVNGDPIELSPTEFRLLSYLMDNPNRVLSKERLLDVVWGITFETSTTVVETFISYLRKKLGPSAASHIKTVRGVGFKVVESV